MLRPGTKADVAAMYGLDCLCFEEPFRFDLRTMRRLATQPESMVVIDENNGEMRAFVIVEVSRRREIACGYIATIDVHPGNRREGLAQSLMVEVDRRGREIGLEQISLHVFAGNHAAVAFYENSGYQRVAKVCGFYGEGLDAFTYIKQL